MPCRKADWACGRHLVLVVHSHRPTPPREQHRPTLAVVDTSRTTRTSFLDFLPPSTFAILIRSQRLRARVRSPEEDYSPQYEVSRRGVAVSAKTQVVLVVAAGELWSCYVLLRQTSLEWDGVTLGIQHRSMRTMPPCASGATVLCPSAKNI